MTADRQPDEINELTKLVSKFMDQFKSIEHEIDDLKGRQKELVEEYKDKLDIKALQAAMRIVKIKKKIEGKDTLEIFEEIVSEKESV